MKNLLFLTFGVIAIALASHVETLACTCVDFELDPKTEVPRARRSADAVFLGRVLQVTSDDRIKQTDTIRFKVERTWKGPVRADVNIFTGNSGGDCGFRFKVGETYLVYANESKNKLDTTFCHRTAVLAAAAADLKILGEGKAVRPISKPQMHEDCKLKVEGGKYKWKGVAPSLDDPTSISGFILIRPKEVNKEFLIKLARRLKKEHCSANYFIVSIFDTGKYANPLSSLDYLNSGGKTILMRGYYSFDRTKGTELLEFSNKLGNPTTENYFDLTKPQ